MNKRLAVGFAFAMVLASGSAFADQAAAVPADVCARSAEDVQKLAYDAQSHLVVQNQGGLLNGGVCWWHSRLQRASLFLATFRPDLPKATQSQGVAIINELANMSQVVVIPGYATFADFSADFEHEIISRLDAWQRSDGFLGFRWVDGLKGHWHVAPGTLQGIMASIHKLVSVDHRILFEKLHFNSIATHAYLVIGSRQTESGYEIDVIDSNHPTETLTVSYHPGQTSLYTADGGEAFVPYLDFDGDMGKINGALHRYCGANGHTTELN